MPTSRCISRVVAVPPLHPGFIGPGHLAAEVVSPDEFALNDPFIALMDDHIDIGERPVGGAHPHAGFETVTLILEGAVRDRDEGGVINTGEVQWMTAGRGIVHGENVEAIGRVRLLQLWLTLPKAQRSATPRFQDVHEPAIPVRREDGVTVRLYSGTSGTLRSATLNHVPVTLAEVVLEPGRMVDQDLPASYNGFAFVISGDAAIGAEGTRVLTNQVGWLNRPETAAPPAAGTESSVLRIAAGDAGVRLVLYAGKPTGDPIVSHGPFIADTREDIARLYGEFRAGTFVRMSQLARAARG